MNFKKFHLRLSSAGDDILSDSALVENLEHTKRAASEVEDKVVEAKKTSAEIDVAREFYRLAGSVPCWLNGW